MCARMRVRVRVCSRMCVCVDCRALEAMEQTRDPLKILNGSSGVWLPTTTGYAVVDPVSRGIPSVCRMVTTWQACNKFQYKRTSCSEPTFTTTKSVG